MGGTLKIIASIYFHVKYNRYWKCLWHNSDYCHRKWIWRTDLKSRIMLFVLSHSVNTLRKGMHSTILPSAMGR